MDQSSVVAVDGVRLAVRRIGAGRPVVCLSAVAHGSADFQPLVDRLGGPFECVLIDWPSHGLSGPDTQPASARRYATLLGGALEAMAIARPILIGNSIGGAAALLHAQDHAVAGIVLCDSGGLVAVTPAIRRGCRTLVAFFRAGARGAWWFGAAYGLYYRFVLPAPAARERRRAIVADGRRMAPVLAQAWESFGEPEADIRGVAAGLDVPVLVAWAKQDRVIPLSACLPAIKAMRHVTVTTFKGGHAPFLERPDEFAAAFTAFAGGLDRAAPLSEIGTDAEHQIA